MMWNVEVCFVSNPKVKVKFSGVDNWQSFGDNCMILAWNEHCDDGTIIMGRRLVIPYSQFLAIEFFPTDEAEKE